MRIVAMWAGCAALWASALHAASENPWVESDAKVYAEDPPPSTFSIEAFHASPSFKGLAPKEFCRKLYEIYYDGRRKNWGAFQQGMTLWAHTGQEPRASPHVIELDPVVLLNTHGTGYCGIQSGLLEGIYQSRPGGTPGKPAIEARRWFLDGIVHSVCDAYYDGAWHYYDIDIGGWAGDAQKDVWSVADVIADPSGYFGAKTPLRAKYFFGADGNGSWVTKINGAKSYAFQDNLMLGHEMTFALRKGERMTRWFGKDEAGWYEPLPFTKGIEEKQKGCCEVVWAPDAKSFAAEALAADGGATVVAVRCPYTITSSKVETDGRASVSFDLGKTWTPVEADGTVKGAANRWDYLLKIEGGSLKKVTTRALVHPGSLPRVGAAATKMTVTKAAGYQTLTYIPDWSSAEAFAAGTQATGLAYKVSDRLTFTGGEADGAGELRIPVKAPPGCKLVKLSACVMGGTGYPPDPKKYLEVHLGAAGKSALVNRTTDCSPWGNTAGQKVEHWQNNVSGSAELAPCDEAEVKVVVKGGGSVQGVRIFAGYVKEKPAPAEGTLTVTHGFDGQTFVKDLPIAALEKAPQSYTIPNGAKKNQFIRMEVK
ncbi:MAG: hypothetical protein KIS92_16655 [Planctomycetota bacterium]|nr:hypothetical protein [Planctomycetota bacterium]